MAKDTQSNKFFCTFNNPQEYGYDYEAIIKALFENFSTFIYGCICTEQGTTLHYHLLMCFTSRVRWSKVTKHFPHVDVRQAKGSISQCKQYIMKSGKWEDNEEKQHTVVKGSFKEWGEQPRDKGINDTAELLKMIQEGYSNAEIYNTNSEYIKQASIIEKIRFDIKSDELEGKRRLNLEVVYIQGKTGTWKSRYILDTYGDENVCRITNYKNHPFDAYRYHDVLCFEEFRDSLPLAEMLNYLDIYPVNLPARYAHKPLFATKIFIISNWNFEKQFNEEQVLDRESYDALLRRIHKVMVFNDDRSITTYNGVEEYFKAINRTIYRPTYISDENFRKLIGAKPSDNTFEEEKKMDDEMRMKLGILDTATKKKH